MRGGRSPWSRSQAYSLGSKAKQELARRGWARLGWRSRTKTCISERAGDRGRLAGDLFDDHGVFADGAGEYVDRENSLKQPRPGVARGAAYYREGGLSINEELELDWRSWLGLLR